MGCHKEEKTVRRIIRLVIEECDDNAFIGLISAAIVYECGFQTTTKELIKWFKEKKTKEKKNSTVTVLTIICCWVKWMVRTGWVSIKEDGKNIENIVKHSFETGFNDDEELSAFSILRNVLGLEVEPSDPFVTQNTTVADAVKKLGTNFVKPKTAAEFSVLLRDVFTNSNTRSLAYELTRCSYNCVKDLSVCAVIKQNADMEAIMHRSSNFVKWLTYLVVTEIMCDAKTVIVEKLLFVYDHLIELLNFEDAFSIRCALLSKSVELVVSKKKFDAVELHTQAVAPTCVFMEYIKLITSVLDANGAIVPLFAFTQILVGDCCGKPKFVHSGKKSPRTPSTFMKSPRHQSVSSTTSINPERVKLAQELGTHVYQCVRTPYAIKQPLMSVRGLFEAIPDYDEMQVNTEMMASYIIQKKIDATQKSDMHICTPFFQSAPQNSMDHKQFISKRLSSFMQRKSSGRRSSMGAVAEVLNSPSPTLTFFPCMCVSNIRVFSFTSHCLSLYLFFYFQQKPGVVHTTPGSQVHPKLDSQPTGFISTRSSMKEKQAVHCTQDTTSNDVSKKKHPVLKNSVSMILYRRKQA